MMKLVALSLLVCEANAFQNLGARVNELEAQAEVMKGLVQCLSEATACVEAKIYGAFHRRDACSMAW